MIGLTVKSKAPAHQIDAAFFAVNCNREFRARPLDQADHPGLEGIVLFDGRHGEPLNFTIIKNIGQARFRQSFFIPSGTPLGDDAGIAAFLRSRGIDHAKWLRP